MAMTEEFVTKLYMTFARLQWKWEKFRAGVRVQIKEKGKIISLRYIQSERFSVFKSANAPLEKVFDLLTIRPGAPGNLEEQGSHERL